MKHLLPACIFFLIASNAFAQAILDIRIDTEEDTPAIAILQSLEDKYPIRFFYLDEWLRFSTVGNNRNAVSLRELLDEIVRSSDLSYSVFFDYAIVFTKDPTIAKQRENLLYSAAAAKKNIQVLTLGRKEHDFRPGKRVQVHGHVKSELNGELITGAAVHVENLNISTITDARGAYQLTLPAGEHVVTFHSQNYSDKVIDLRAYVDGALNVILEDAPTLLQEVVVSDQAVVSGRAGQSSILIRNLKRAPTFLGELDVIKNLQVQPGVTSVGEVSSGFNVRGGGTDQNLVLYDGVPILNTSHALGFFSGFNPEAIGTVNFYRGGIPAEFGSRASSVLSITSKEGDYKKWTASGGIGIISSNLAVGGPIKRDTTSVAASFRTSYSNWLLRQVRSNYAQVGESSLAFMDGSFKLAHKLNAKTKIQLSAYGSRDEFSLANDTLYRWQNLSTSVRIDHMHSDRLLSSMTLGIGSYHYELQEEDPENAFVMRYGVTYPSVNFDFNRNGAHALSFGLHNVFYNFNPGHIRPNHAESTQDEIAVADENSLESALYISDEFYWRENIAIEIGLRYSLYNRLGAATVYRYLPGAGLEPRNTIDSVNFKTNKIIKTYHGAEPRLSLRYLASTTASIKVGYNRIFQYLHLITNTAAVTPVDIWQSSNMYFKPQIADQLSVGYYKTVKNNMYEAFVEVYYKNIQNVLEFKDGYNLILNKKIETALIRGKAISYGAEFSLSKVKGRLQGMTNYTYSRSLRKVNGFFDNEKINDGAFYASNYDQPHVANVSWRYGISRRHFFSGNFTYHTGRPMSVPRDGYIIDGNVISDFSERNTFRIPDYHRLDLALIIEGTHKRKKLLDGTWTVSFYNIYSRKNAYSVFYAEDKSSGKLVPYKLSVIGTVIPSISYGFTF
ncbi:MAG TPA: carboxypeptidase-like regulatory domain-containing protein [Chryseosolibacter sp.]